MKTLTCIVCPRGCKLNVDDDFKVTGNLCYRGVTYAKSELTNPVRILTSTVRIESEIITLLSVSTSDPVPKDRLLDIMNELKNISVKAPIKINDVIISNVLDLKVDIIATRTIEK